MPEPKVKTAPKRLSELQETQLFACELYEFIATFVLTEDNIESKEWELLRCAYKDVARRVSKFNRG